MRSRNRDGPRSCKRRGRRGGEHSQERRISMGKLEGRVALVTGANKGIGFEISRQLARRGITVVIGARDETRGAEAAAKLRDEGLDAHHVRLDVTDASTIDPLPQLFEERFGRLIFWSITRASCWMRARLSANWTSRF